MSWLLYIMPLFPVAQRLKRLPPMWETQVRSLGQEDPLEKEMVTHSSILAWRIPWMEKPGRLQTMGSQRVGHDWATSLSLSFTMNMGVHVSFWASLVAQLVKNPPAMWKTWVPSLGWKDPLEKGIHFSLENSMDYTVHGVAKRGTQLSDCDFHFLPWYTFFSWFSGNCIFVTFFVSGHSHLLSWFWLNSFQIFQDPAFDLLFLYSLSWYVLGF